MTGCTCAEAWGAPIETPASRCLGVSLTEELPGELVEALVRLDVRIAREMAAASWWSRRRILAGWFATLEPARVAIATARLPGRALNAAQWPRVRAALVAALGAPVVVVAGGV